MDSLASRTIKCKQYKALDFAKLANLPYISQVKQSNLNLALFSFGSIKHLLYLVDGTLPPVKNSELCARLQHLSNVLEIVALSGSLNDFDNNAWKIGKEYDARIIADIEHGIKTWDGLDQSIDPTAWQFAREIISKSKPAPSQNKSQSNGNSNRICTTWNTFRKEGCSWEHSNPGETCVYAHVCSKCKKRHKAWQCSVDDKSPAVSAPASGSTSTTATATPVTSA